MLRIFNLLLSYWRPLFFVTIAVVFIFQLNWLRERFKSGKRQLLQQIEFSIKSQLLSLKMKRIADLGNTPSDSVRLIPKMDSVLKIVKELYVNDLPNTVVGDYYGSIPMRVKKTTLTNVLQKLKNSEGYDSVLYIGLQKDVPALAAAPFLVIHHQPPDKKSMYPRKSAVAENDKYLAITYVLSNGSYYRIYVDTLNWTIFKGLWPQFLVSFLYILLFLITIGILLHAGRMNKKLLESKNNFTRNMTHELKIPISTLHVGIESLDKYYNNAGVSEASRYMGFMKQSLHQLSSIIDSILTNARMEEGKTDFRLRATDITILLRDVIKEMTLQIGEKQGMIILNAPEHPIILNIDASLMKNVFLNLFDNSLKYNDRPPVITICFKHTGSRIGILVSDNGKGIATEYAEDIFQPYFRIENNDIHDVKGYGLGLSYVREIIHLHGGSIKVKRSNQNGTEMEINIPWTPEKK